jgi:hypothetical protein
MLKLSQISIIDQMLKPEVFKYIEEQRAAILAKYTPKEQKEMLAQRQEAVQVQRIGQVTRSYDGRRYKLVTTLAVDAEKGFIAEQDRKGRIELVRLW